MGVFVFVARFPYCGAYVVIPLLVLEPCGLVSWFLLLFFHPVRFPLFPGVCLVLGSWGLGGFHLKTPKAHSHSPLCCLKK